MAGGEVTFSGAAWDLARSRLGGGAPTTSAAHTGLLADVTAEAARDGVVDARERKLLEALHNPANLDVLRRHSGDRTATFSPSELTFTAKAHDVMAAGAETYLASDRLAGRYVPEASVNRDKLADRASATTISLGGSSGLTLANAEGRLAILDAFGQMASSADEAGAHCSAATLVGLAVFRGREELLNVARMIMRDGDRGADSDLRRIADALSRPTGSISVADLNTLTEHLYEMLHTAQGDDSPAGITPETLQRFVSGNDALRGLFRGDETLRGIHLSGDAAIDHYVLALPGCVFDPAERKGAGGHHVVRNPAAVADYAAAAGAEPIHR